MRCSKGKPERNRGGREVDGYFSSRSYLPPWSLGCEVGAVSTAPAAVSRTRRLLLPGRVPSATSFSQWRASTEPPARDWPSDGLGNKLESQPREDSDFDCPSPRNRWGRQDSPYPASAPGATPPTCTRQDPNRSSSGLNRVVRVYGWGQSASHRGRGIWGKSGPDCSNAKKTTWKGCFRISMYVGVCRCRCRRTTKLPMLGP